MKAIRLPVLPNSPVAIGSNSVEGDFSLKSFGEFEFVQNALFDEALIRYGQNYQNDQSQSGFFLRHMNEVYSLLRAKCSKGDRLVEIGCGKGAFLEIVKADGFFQYAGYDTAYEGNDENIEPRYLDEDDRIEADVVVLRHTLEHVKAPHLFLNQLKKVFGDEALVFIEVPQLDWIAKYKVLFDFTYEHVNYFSSKSLSALFSENLERADTFGGQYQYCFARFGALDVDGWTGFDRTENWREFNFDDYLDAFAKSVEFLRHHKRLWVWGGATKGVLFLKHLADVEPAIFHKVVGVVDINEKKQSLHTPSTYVPILSPSEMARKADKSDFVIVMNPNYKDEVREQLSRLACAAVRIGSI